MSGDCDNDTNELTLLSEIKFLRYELFKKESQLRQMKKDSSIVENPLDGDDITRYSRQMLMLGPDAQKRIKKSSVLIIGAGGIGCPAALYLVGAGIGKLGIVDYDVVKLDNLHRQILYGEEDLTLPKVQVASNVLGRINHKVKVKPVHCKLDAQNVVGLLEEFDIVLDASDNVVTRYLLNDGCILTKRTLISGSALRSEGQLTVYNYDGGPCYRCLYPEPPPPQCVTNCNEGGVIGPVPGIIGTLGALEVIKIITKVGDILSSKLLIFDGFEAVFRKVRLRSRKKDCRVCGDSPDITELINYEEFCGAKADDKGADIHLLKDQDRITVSELQSIRQKKQSHLLVDVRSPNEYAMCHLEGSFNIPLNQLTYEAIENHLHDQENHDKPYLVLLVCRRGNDSQKAVIKLKEKYDASKYTFKDIVEGLHGWASTIDDTFPIY